MSGRHPDFDVHALYQALDSARQARGLSWTQVAREISGLYADTPAGPISPSTLSGLRSRHEIEGDGVLQMLRWLHRTPESFVPGSTQMGLDAELPPVGAHRILRFDAKSIYGALDARRVERALTWNQVAKKRSAASPRPVSPGWLAEAGSVSPP